MESATILTPPSTGERYSAFCQNPKFLKDQVMKKNQQYIDFKGRSFINSTPKQRQMLRPQTEPSEI